MTDIGDSESDIYEPWVQIRQASGHLLIRAGRDRLLYDKEATLSSQPSAGQYRLDVPAANPRINRLAPSAAMVALRLFSTQRLIPVF